ncbi:SAV_6107 family HEPN domain-containing protein [Dactylosporangium salmoneum]|uniref:SAV-6107-like HEPN domain-containing protein n=1 Tax=Dactylosporangium salmoneum TaxID=53361 RepID=A0ABN3GAB8_9ACTN
MTAARVTLPVPAHALPARTPRELLVKAREGLAEAAEIGTPGMRYATAHLAALRCAAAVLAARALPAPGRPRARVTSVWSLLPLVAPELTEWASHFAATSSKRAAAEAGIPQAVTGVEADALLASATQFCAVVETVLGGAR